MSVFVVTICRYEFPPIIVSSDAQFEVSEAGGGVLYFDPCDGARNAYWCHITEEQLDEWGFSRDALSEGRNPIQCCEAAMVPWGLLEFGATNLHRRKVVWFVDNTSALFAAIRGSSRNVIVSRAMAAATFLCFHFNCNIWYEFVDNESNLAHGLNRKGAADDFVSRKI